MKAFRKILCATLTTSVLLAASSMTTYAETETTIQKEVSITLDDVLSYVDSNNDDVINDGDIIYYGTEGFYLWDTPSDEYMAIPDARLRAVSVKKVNSSTYLQDDNAPLLIFLSSDEIAYYTDEYVNKLNTDCGATYVNSDLIKKSYLKQGDGYGWMYEFNWWSRHWHNTYQMFLPAVVTTGGAWQENGSGPAYLRPAVSVKVSDVVEAKNKTYTCYITSENGQVNLEVAGADQVTINTVADEGYTLDTLSVTDKNGNAIPLNENKFTMPAKDVDIKANFKKQEHVVSFNSDGGSDVTSQTLEHGGVLTIPTSPTKANYIFDGWYCEEECITKYDFATSVTAQFVLYAKWIPCECSYEWKIDVEPTTTMTGLKHEECSSCGAVRNNNTEIPVVENVQDSETGYADNMLIYMALLLVAGFGCVIMKNYKLEEKQE